jgi:hypothetical protein
MEYKDERLKRIVETVDVTYIGLDLGRAIIKMEDFDWLVRQVELLIEREDN